MVGRRRLLVSYPRRLEHARIGEAQRVRNPPSLEERSGDSKRNFRRNLELEIDVLLSRSELAVAARPDAAGRFCGETNRPRIGRLPRNAEHPLHAEAFDAVVERRRLTGEFRDLLRITEMGRTVEHDELGAE